MSLVPKVRRLPEQSVAAAAQAIELVQGRVELSGRSAGGEQLLQQTNTRESELPAPHVSRLVLLELRQVIAVSPRCFAAADRPPVGARTHLATVRTRSRLISVTERELVAAGCAEGGTLF